MEYRVVTLLRRLVAGAILTSAALAAAQSLAVDTLSQERAVLPSVEPPRPGRRTDGVHRLVDLQYATAVEGTDRFRSSLPELVAFLQAQVDLGGTRFVVEGRGPANFADGEPLLVLLTGNRALLNLNDRQKERLGTYLKSGGLLFAEDVRGPLRRGRGSDVGQSGTPFDRLLKALVAHPLVLGSAGLAWRPVPRGHELFRSFYPLPEGPPLVGMAAGRRDVQVTELEMLEYRGRVAVVFSDLNITPTWAVPEAVGRERALRFGVNLVVFALAQYAGAGGP